MGTKTHPARLGWAYAGRTLQSYADGKKRGDVFIEYQHMRDAMQFAEANWASELILDSWVSIVEIYVQDPSELRDSGYHKNQPTTKALLGVCLNRELKEIINDHSKPESELFDEVVSEMTLDRFVWHELSGGRGGYTEFNCAYCGHGLDLSGCTGCGHCFEGNHFRCGWSTPLSRKMIAFLQTSGLVFKKDPEITWQVERHQFEQIKTRFAAQE